MFTITSGIRCYCIAGVFEVGAQGGDHPTPDRQQCQPTKYLNLRKTSESSYSSVHTALGKVRPWHPAITEVEEQQECAIRVRTENFQKEHTHESPI